MEQALSLLIRYAAKTSSYLICKGSTTLNGEYAFYITASGTLKFVMIDEDSAAYIGQESSADLSPPYEGVFGVTYNGTQVSAGIQLYHNQLLVPSTAVSYGIYTQRRSTDYPITIGYNSGGLASAPDGVIGPVWIADRYYSRLQMFALAKRLQNLGTEGTS